ncbi:hypothetical protein GEMRC1_002849 [Eukaryota sp. GEM-RC1]
MTSPSVIDLEQCSSQPYSQAESRLIDTAAMGYTGNLCPVNLSFFGDGFTFCSKNGSSIQSWDHQLYDGHYFIKVRLKYTLSIDGVDVTDMFFVTHDHHILDYLTSFSSNDKSRKRDMSVKRVNISNTDKKTFCVGLINLCKETRLLEELGSLTLVKQLVPLDGNDIVQLKPFYFLNDNLIDHCLADVISRVSVGEQQLIYAYNCFFYTQLRELENMSEPGRLANWHKKGTIFEKQMVFIPIHDCNHWMLVAIINPDTLHPDYTPETHQPVLKVSRTYRKFKVILFNSLNFNIHQCLQRVCKFLEAEYKRLFDNKLVLASAQDRLVPNVPCQFNDYDCGLFVLTYAQQLLVDPPSTPKNYSRKDWTEWFDPGIVSTKRREFTDRILTKIENSEHRKVMEKEMQSLFVEEPVDDDVDADFIVDQCSDTEDVFEYRPPPMKTRRSKRR